MKGDSRRVKNRMKKIIKKLTPDFIIGTYHWCWALAGAIVFRFPSKRLIVIGVTGTKGKSTTVYLSGKILEEAGYKIGWISSLSLKIGPQEDLNPYHMTMPGRWRIQQLLRQMVNAGCQYALVEVTSEGILQHRQAFIDFDCVVFTNLAAEHIEAHGSFDNYMKAKGKLFKALGKSSKKETTSIINLDDGVAEYFLKFPAKTKIGFRLEAEGEQNVSRIVRPQEYALSQYGAQFLLEDTKIDLYLVGLFNLYNALAAIAVALSRGIPLAIAKGAIAKIKEVPGRMEKIQAGQNYSVIVDLAHTPDSFTQVLETIKNNTKGKLICVFGSAGGGRDKWKRPEFGKIAAQFCQKIILTNEDPYDEDPVRIINEIAEGATKSGYDAENLLKIPDRREAISKGLSLAQNDDAVVILGKGTEATMIVGDKKIPWDDRQVAREEIAKSRG